MTRTRRFLGGLTIGYANQAVVMLVGLWLTAFLLKALGSHDYGLWLVTSQILGYLLLADFGIVALLPRETAYATGRAGGAASSQELRELIGHTLRLVLWELPLVAAAAVLVWIFLPKDWEPLRGPLALVLFTFVATFPLRMLNGILQGLQDLAYLGTVQLISWSIGTATAAVMAFRGYGLYALTMGWVVSQGLSAILWWWRLRSRFRDALPTSLPPMDWQRMKTYVSKSIWVSVAQVAQVFLNGSDVLVIGKLLGPAAAVPYFCTAKLISVLANQPQMVMQAAAPALSELKTAESRERLLSVCTALTRAMLITSGAVGAVVLAVNEGFVHWWVGADRYGGTRLTVALIAVMIVRHWNTTAVYSIFAFGRERRTSITALADGLTTLGAALVLVPRLGLLGAPLASLLGVTLVGLPWNLAALAHETGVSLFRLVAAVGPWAWRFLLASGIAVLAINPLASGRPQWLALGAAGISAVYALLMLPFALRDPLGQYVRPRIAALRARFT